MSDSLAHLRSLCIEQPKRAVYIPVLVWSILFWLDGFMVGVALVLVTILAKAAR